MSKSARQGVANGKKDEKSIASNMKITTFFSNEGLVRSTSKPSFQSKEQKDYHKSKEKAYREDDHSFEWVDELKELQNKSKINESQAQDEIEMRKQRALIDTEPESAEEEEEQNNNEIKIVAKEVTEESYQLPHNQTASWKIKANLLGELVAKRHIKKHELYTQMTKLFEVGSEGRSYHQNLDSFKQFIDERIRDKKQEFLEEFIPFLAGLALEITQIHEIPILKSSIGNSLTLSKRQIACLLANMFFGTLLTQSRSKNLPYGTSFKNIFAGSLNYSQNERKIEKIACLYNYFQRVRHTIKKYTSNINQLRLTFQRLVFNSVDHKTSDVSTFWKSSKVKLTNVTHSSSSSIEDFQDAIHIDFANEYIGGGVLDHGLVQEEIRFLISPELIVSRLFCPKMGEHEAIIILGSEQYSRYSGYGDTFRFDGDKDESGIAHDAKMRIKTAVLAIDAINYGHSYDKSVQYKMQTIVREILKAYIGFQGGSELQEIEDNQKRCKLSTGRWGCGIFMGDPQLKFLIQWIAASQANRDMIFCSFKDPKFEDLHKIIHLLQDKTVGDIFILLHKYTEFYNKLSTKQSIFQFCHTFFECQKVQGIK